MPEPPQTDEQLQETAAGANAAIQSMIRRDDTMALAFQGVLPSSLGEAWQLSQHLARSQAVPQSAKNGGAETVLTIIMAGMELGLTPIRALQSITNIKGNLAMRADLILALARRSGTLAYFNEGFEFAGKTDGTLEHRLRLAKDPEAREHAELIYGLTEDVPDGKPYGWAIAQRKGDHQMHLRVFTWDDAERFIFNASDEDEGSPGGQRKPRENKKLSEKTNYRNSPQDMYPKRARVRVLQVTHSDASAGMPAIEAMDGVIIEGEVVNQVTVTSSEDTIAELIQAIKQKDPALAGQIVAGMDQLQMGIAKRLTKLRQFEADPNALLEWLRTEYANLGGGRVRRDVLGGGNGQAQAQAKPVVPAASTAAPPKADQKPAAVDTPQPEPTKPAAGMESVKAIADRFKSGMTF